MDWTTVRDRYLAIVDKSGANTAWHLAIGYYVADRWIAEGVALQGKAYDAALTEQVWDSNLTLAGLEKLEADSLKALEDHIATHQTLLDKAAFQEALKDFGALKTADVELALGAYGALKAGGVEAALTAYGAAKPSDVETSIRSSNRMDWGWFLKTLIEGPVTAAGIVLFGFGLTLGAAIFSPVAQSALKDLGGVALQAIRGPAPVSSPDKGN